MASETISYSLGDGNLIINDADTHPTADSDILEFDDFDDIDEVYRDGNDLVFLMTDGAIIRAVGHFFGKDLEQIKDVTNNVTLDVSFSLTGFAGTDDLVVGTTGATSSMASAATISSAATTILSGDHGNDSIFGGDGDDWLIGGDGDDRLEGGDGDDELEGGEGDDTLDGGADNDLYLFESGDGNDTVTDSGGTDTVEFYMFDEIVDAYRDGDDIVAEMDDGSTLRGVDHFAGTGNEIESATDEAGSATYSIQTGLTGTGADEIIVGTTGNETLDGQGGSDVLFGHDGDDRLKGGDGNDMLFGGDGSDRLEGGADNDYLDGGASALNGSDRYVGSTGNDTLDFGGGSFFYQVDYTGLAGPISVDLSTSTADKGASGTDTFQDLDQISSDSGIDVWGTAGDDSFTGTGVVGFQEWRPGAGTDSITGGSNTDRLSYQNAGSGNVTVNLATGQAIDWTGATDTFSGIEQVETAAGDDTITGDGGSNSFRTKGGNDSIDGGGGTDELRYSGASGSVIANIGTSTATDGFGGTDSFTNIENLRGGSHDDTLTGDGGNNQLKGQAGDDTLDGAGGTDEADYGSEAFEGATSGVTVDLSAQTATDGFGDTDTLISIENVDGGRFDDDITGDSGSNRLRGLAGDDTLRGGGGNDTLDGGKGNNLLVGDDDDTLIGGTHADPSEDINKAGYVATTGAIVATLDGSATVTGNSSVGTDSLSNIDKILGSDFGDTFTVSSDYTGQYGGFVEIRGGDGNDTITGDSTGTVTTRVAYDDSDAGVHVQFGLGGANGTATSLGGGGSDNIGTDTFTYVRDVRGSTHADTLMGSDGTDFESFRGLGGNDLIDGGDGTQDQADYLSSSSGVTVNIDSAQQFGIAGGTALDGHGGTDTLVDIEWVRGSFNDDSIHGSAGDNRLIGLGGDDWLIGAGGNDTLEGGAGEDRYDYDSGEGDVTIVDTSGWEDELNVTDGSLDDLVGARMDGNDLVLEFSGGAAAAQGGPGGQADNDEVRITDHFNGQQVEFLFEASGAGDGREVELHIGDTGGFDDDLIAGGDGDDTLDGREGDDILFGDGGNDSLIGGAGDDTIDGGTGSNKMSGGYGDDMITGGTRASSDDFNVVTYSDATEAITAGLDSDATVTATDTIGADTIGTDMLVNIDKVVGTGFADTFSVDAAYTSQFGSWVEIEGGDGDDTITGDSTGTVTTRISYGDSAAGVHVQLGLGGASGSGQSLGSGGSDNVGSDTFTYVREVRGSGFDDTLTGSDGADYESFRGQGGNDVIDGGGGTKDRADYANSSSGIVVDLGLNTATDGLGGTDTLTNIEWVRGSGHDDTIMGDNAANSLAGQDGNDRLDGTGGNDTLDGGAGDDTYHYDYHYDLGDGSDTINDSDGTDDVFSVGDIDDIDSVLRDGDDLVFTFSDAATVRIKNHFAGQAVENLFEPGSGDEFDIASGAVGSSEDDLIAGTNVADTLDGQGGNDWLFGDDGNDSLLGGSGVDTLIGGDGDDSVDGGSGDDLIVGGSGAGNDTYAGGDDTDTVTYASTTAGVTVDLGAGTASGSEIGTDSLSAIENVVGGSGNDTITGNGDNNTLFGNGGVLW